MRVASRCCGEVPQEMLPPVGGLAPDMGKKVAVALEQCGISIKCYTNSVLQYARGHAKCPRGNLKRGLVGVGLVVNPTLI